jgi:hypothetical protein
VWQKRLENTSQHFTTLHNSKPDFRCNPFETLNFPNKTRGLRKLLNLILSPARLPVPPLRHVLRGLGTFQAASGTTLNVSLVNSAGQAPSLFP